jgi:hypothetical protein
MKSVMTPQQLFNRVSKPRIQRSTFDRSHGYKTTFNAGKLIPFYVDEALPGDTFKMKTHMFGRVATLINPIMDNVMLDVHFFSVPYRLVWDNWQKFMGEQVDPGDSTDFLIPTITSTSTSDFDEGSIYDYLGIPTKVSGVEISALPLRAIKLIWNEWYRDENLQDSYATDTGDGPDNPGEFILYDRGKRKDYFTSALPFAQKGDPVTIPLAGSEAPVLGIGPQTTGSWGSTQFYETGGSGLTSYAGTKASSVDPLFVAEDPNNSGYPYVRADLSSVSAQTINSLREAIAIQQLLERDARGGTRYTEIIYAHFGVKSLDARLQRPKFLGGRTFNLNVSAIAQTSATEAGSPQANLAAMGTFSTNEGGFMKTFTEHEIVIGFISARADLNYQQGLNRMWSRSTRYDFYFPEFAHLGEQSVLNKEIYTQGTSADDDVFGYQERYADYRYKPSMVTSDFRSNATASLDSWHLSQDFSSLPVLNDTFVVENPPMDRIKEVTTEEDFIVDCYLDLKCTRPMPVYSVPGLETI